MAGPYTLNLSASAVADSTGQATFQFSPVGLGQVLTGSVFCPTAPAGAAFSPNLGGIPFAPWTGPGYGGALQGFPGMVLVVTAVGLVPNQRYALQWVGTNTAPGAAPAPPTPSAGGQAPPVVVFLNDQKHVIASTATLGPFAVGGVSLACNFQTDGGGANNAAAITLLWKGVDPITGNLITLKTQTVGVPASNPGGYGNGLCSFVVPTQGTQLAIQVSSFGGTVLSSLIYSLEGSFTSWEWASGPYIPSFNADGCLLNVQNGSLASGSGTLAYFSSFTLPGPAVWSVVTNQPWHAEINIVDGTSGGGGQLTQVQSTDSNVGVRWRTALMIPPFPLQVVFHNDGGATANFFSTLVPDVYPGA